MDDIYLVVLIPIESERRTDDVEQSPHVGAGNRRYEEGWDRIFGTRSATLPREEMN